VYLKEYLRSIPLKKNADRIPSPHRWCLETLLFTMGFTDAFTSSAPSRYFISTKPLLHQHQAVTSSAPSFYMMSTKFLLH
jgi:hypothetical protein